MKRPRGNAIGLISLPASFIAGVLWDRISPAAPFFFGSGIAFAALVLFIIFWRTSPRKNYA